MARSSASKIPSVPMAAAVMAVQKAPKVTVAAVKPIKAHGMSVKIKPERIPHSTDPTRDVYGRKLPGQLPANAAKPFTAKDAAAARAMRAQKNAAATVKAPTIRPATPPFRAPVAQSPKVNMTPPPPGGRNPMF